MRAKTIAEVKTYDPNDCTSVGYDVKIMDNGYMRVEKRSRWQGDTTGTVWMIRASKSIMAAARAEVMPDLKLRVWEYLTEKEWIYWAKKIRNGVQIR